MKKKRERLEVVHDILDTVQKRRKIGPTRLLQLSNLSPQMFREYMEDLTQAGLLDERDEDGRKKYVSTDKGDRFLQEYRVFANFVDQLGL